VRECQTDNDAINSSPVNYSNRRQQVPGEARKELCKSFHQ